MSQLPELESVKNSPTVFVIFGATGDLARKKIFPSFFELSKNNLLPEKFKIIAAARSQFTSESFTESLKDTITFKDKNDWEKFAKQVEYVNCDIAENINLDVLKRTLDNFEKDAKACTQRVLYMSISPFIYDKAFENVGKSGLNLGCSAHSKKARIVIEKPFGHDLKSALSLNEKLTNYFNDSEIYRIDHFLGKETVQNIFAFRFGNEIFEPVWNNQYVDHVQIIVAEHVGVEKRGDYYDKAGALRDVMQNHLLQLMSLVTMEEPAKFDHDSIHLRKLELLQSVKRMDTDEIVNSTARGQYQGYLDEENIKTDSNTETYALAKMHIENDRWRGVPFYLRTGKKLTGKVTSIIFAFKERENKLLQSFHDKPIPNHVTLQIQPNEGIGIRLAAKKPGLTTQIEPVDMEFCYKNSFDTPQPDAYERLLMDIIVGDQTLFIGQVAQSWKIIDPIEEVWKNQQTKPEIYKPGSWGPEAADKLIEKDNREWLAPLLTICKI